MKTARQFQTPLYIGIADLTRRQSKGWAVTVPNSRGPQACKAVALLRRKPAVTAKTSASAAAAVRACGGGRKEDEGAGHAAV